MLWQKYPAKMVLTSHACIITTNRGLCANASFKAELEQHSRSLLEHRLEIFYQTYAPKIKPPRSRIQQIARDFVNRMEVLNEGLYAKYGACLDNLEDSTQHVVEDDFPLLLNQRVRIRGLDADDSYLNGQMGKCILSCSFITCSSISWSRKYYQHTCIPNQVLLWVLSLLQLDVRGNPIQPSKLHVPAYVTQAQCASSTEPRARAGSLLIIFQRKCFCSR
jgi:hypothetical protein